MRAKFIYEKFEQDSDPISDLDIGKRGIWKDALENEFNIDKYYKQEVFFKYLDLELVYEKFYKKQYFDNNIYDEHANKTLAIIKEMLKKLVKNTKLNEQELFNEICKDIFRGQGLYTDYWIMVYAIKKQAAYILRDKFGINVKPYYKKKKIKESLNEKFTSDSDPIDDLGIGIAQLIKDAPNNIFLEDLKLNGQPNIDFINVEGGYGIPKRFIIVFVLERLKDKNGRQVNRKNYIYNIIENLGLMRVFSSIEQVYHQRDIMLRIKPEYQKYFTRGTFINDIDL